MDDKFIIALIAASSALFGAAIPTLFNYWNNNTQRKFEIKKAILEKQRQIYSELMLCLQQMINTNKNEDFLSLQRVVLQVSIYGDDSTSFALNEYYTAIIASAQPNGTPLVKHQHQLHQTRIINGMRASLDLQPLPTFEVVSFRPPE